MSINLVQSSNRVRPYPLVCVLEDARRAWAKKRSSAYTAPTLTNFIRYTRLVFGCHVYKITIYTKPKGKFPKGSIPLSEIDRLDSEPKSRYMVRLDGFDKYGLSYYLYCSLLKGSPYSI